MKGLGATALREHFVLLGVKRGSDVLVHSNLAACGVIENGVPGIYSALRDLIGETATIIVPTYRISAPADEVFDPLRSPSLQVGSFSEYVRQRTGVYRSICPIHSHAFDGPLATYAEVRGLSPSFGTGSDFELMIENGIHCLFIGCDFEKAGTFVFHTQATSGAIVYRSWEQSHRRVRMPASIGAVTTTKLPYYARRPEAPRETRKPLQNQLENEGLILEAPLPYGRSLGFELPAVHDRVLKLLTLDPWLCTKKDSLPL